MGDHDITLRTADGDPAVVVTITTLETGDADALAEAARDAVARVGGDSGAGLLTRVQRHRSVTSVARTDGQYEILVDAPAVPVGVAAAISDAGLEITSVGPHGSGDALLVEAE